MGFFDKNDAIVPHEESSLAEVAEAVAAIAPLANAALDFAGQCLRHKAENRQLETVEAAHRRQLDSFDLQEERAHRERMMHMKVHGSVLLEMTRNGKEELAVELLREMLQPEEPRPVPPMSGIPGSQSRGHRRHDDFIDVDGWVRDDPKNDRGGPR